jgi:signal transduction histidine kinase
MANPLPRNLPDEELARPRRRPAAGRRSGAAGTTSGRPVTAEFFRDLVDSMRNGVIAITRSGQLAVMNPEAYRILAVRQSPDDLERHYTAVLRDCPDIIRIFAAAFDLRHLPNRAELRLRATSRVIGYTLSLVRDSAGSIAGASLFFKDLTRVEQLEERERLRDRLAALGEMAAAIAHEVKNPLAGIEVMAGLLKRRLVDQAESHDLLNDIIKEAKMANAIVLEVLDFVRPIRLQVEPVSLTRIVDDAVQMAESLVPRGTVDVVVHMSPDLPAVDADAHQLRQLFTNLVANAFEALNRSGTVVVTGSHARGEHDPLASPSGAGSVVITVADDGPGVPEDIRDRIFSPFFTTKPRGSGLGLPIVRKIVDAHEGRIDLEVGAECGTTFRVILPIVVCEDSDAGRTAGR